MSEQATLLNLFNQADLISVGLKDRYEGNCSPSVRGEQKIPYALVGGIDC